jgi:hypothetical protein
MEACKVSASGICELGSEGACTMLITGCGSSESACDMASATCAAVK